MRSYYNENDPYAAGWLRNLVAAGHLPAGHVDDRSILEVEPGDLDGYDECHFFAGIGGWPLALRLAGWPSSRPVWTGSCPCQPFSSAGKQSGAADERHLWPGWLRLIRECRPDAIIGEQVEGAVGFGWLDRVFADLEAEGYACGATVLGAHSVNAPHIRQRLFWVADASGTGSRRDGGSSDQPDEERRPAAAQPGGATGGLADAAGRAGPAGLPAAERQEPRDGYATGGLGLALGPRLEGHAGHGDDRYQPGRLASKPNGSTATAGAWNAAAWLPCLDGKARRAQSGIFPLASGISNRVGRLRAYGNAIVPQAAAAFVSAFMAARP
jgi:DNA (cytosine-5)-methyltransferase 1